MNEGLDGNFDSNEFVQESSTFQVTDATDSKDFQINDNETEKNSFAVEGEAEEENPFQVKEIEKNPFKVSEARKETLKATESEKGYTSPYEKTEYSGTVRIRNKETGEMEDREINRIVYRNSELDPDMVIPAGTKLGKEITIKEETNLDRMLAGKAPLLPKRDSDGNVVYTEDEKGGQSMEYDKLELHHLLSQEKQRGSQYFNGEKREGTMVEIRSSVHDKYDKQLHAINESNKSFRKEVIQTTDKNGNTVREKIKTDDAVQYEKFRVQYWKDRADEINKQRQKDTKS